LISIIDDIEEEWIIYEVMIQHKKNACSSDRHSYQRKKKSKKTYLIEVFIARHPIPILGTNKLLFYS
jgi:hypothetical protein